MAIGTIIINWKKNDDFDMLLAELRERAQMEKNDGEIIVP